MTVQQYPPVFSYGYTEALVYVIVGRAAGRPLATATLHALQTGENVVDIYVGSLLSIAVAGVSTSLVRRRKPTTRI